MLVLALVETGCSKVNEAFPPLLKAASSVAGGNGGSDGSLGSVAQPKLVISPPQLDFGTVALGSTSDLSITLTNSGAATATSLVINSLGPGFTQAGTSCGTTLAVGANCTIAYRFAPTVNGQYGAAVIASSANGGAVAATLQGIGGTGPAGPIPTLEISPSPAKFPKTSVGTTADLAVTVRNTGTVTASSLAIALSGSGFTQQSSTCGSTLAAGGNCIVTVRFNPPGNGVWSGTLAVTASQALATSAVISGEGSGGHAAFSISPSSHAYGSIALGAFSDQVFTITNSGSAPAEAASISLIGAGFSLRTHDCARALNVGEACQATVRFSPSSSGNFNGFLMISAAGADTSMASLSGSALTASAPKGILSLSPVDTGFSSTNVGAHSDQTITVTNTGNAAITNLAAATSGMGFSVQSSTCVGTLGVGATCTVVARFAPAAKGTYGGYIKLTADDASQAVGTLSGSGVSSVALALTPTSFDFGAVTAGQTRSVNLVLSNTGSSPASAISVTSTDPTAFPISFTDCSGVTLAGGASCQISVSFHPTTGSLYSAQLQVSDSVPNTVAAGLRGEGAVPTLSVSPSSYDFGSVVTGAQGTRSFTITNAAAVDASGFAVNALGTAFSIVSNGCAPYASSFPAGQSCSVTAQFSPPGSGTFSGFVTAAATGRATVYGELAGVGGPPALLAATPSTRAFGTTFTSNSPNQVFTLTNTGGVPATAISSTLSDTLNYGMTTTCAATLAPGNSCTITLTYHPTDQNSHPATITVGYFNGVLNRSTTLTASGTGRYPPALAITPASHDFGTLTVGNNASATFTVQNTGSGYASSAAYSTTDPSFVILSNTCPATLAAGANCSISVEFAPNRLATFDNALQIEYAERADLGLAPPSVALEGVAGNGLAWNVQSEATSSLVNIGQITFTSPTTGYVARNYGMIKKTDDGGLTWHSLATGTWSTLHGIAYNLSEIFTVGAASTLKRNANEGLYWETLPFLAPGGTYYHLSCPDSTSCYAPGRSGTNDSILRYDSGTFSESTGLLFPTAADDFTGVFSLDPSTSFVLGRSNNGYILKSEDGGQLYYPLAGNFNLDQASAVSTSVVYAAGERGWVRKSVDGGLSWRSIKSPLTSTLRGISCLDEWTCWIGGASRTSASWQEFYLTTDGGQTWSQKGRFNFNSFAHIATAGASTILVGPADSNSPLLRSTDGGSTWSSNIYPGGRYPATRVQCFNANDCYLSYTQLPSTCDGSGSCSSTIDAGGVLKSTDGGATWKELFGSQPLNQIARVGSTLWVAGDGGYIRKSTDGGLNWQTLSRISHTSSGSAGGIYFLDSNTGWVTSSNGKVYKTTDGGLTWTPSSSTSTFGAGPHRVQFLDASNGWAIASHSSVYRTTNGGSSWSAAYNAANTLYGLHFLDSNRGWFVGANSIVLYTANGGSTWATGSVPVSGVELRAVYFTSALNGWAGGFKASTPVLFKTTDGGATWATVNTGTTARSPRRIVFDSSATRGWIVGASGFAQRTADGGATWSNMPLPNMTQWRDQSLDYADLLDLMIVDDSDPANAVLLATNSFGAIFRSTDGGSSWTQVNVGGTARIVGVVVDPMNSQNIWVPVTHQYGAQNAFLMRSTDGGDSWTRLSTFPCRVNDLAIFNASRFVATCNHGNAELYYSADGGSSWTLVAPPAAPTNTPVFRVEVLDRSAGTAIAVGRWGMILLTQNFGATWSKPSVEPMATPYGIKFVNSNEGWVVGDTFMILKTQDGGMSWQSQPQGAIIGVKGVDFLDANTGFVIGDSGTTLRTTNGGATWSVMSTAPFGGSPRNWNFRHLKALSASELIATASSGAIARWNGSTWTDVTTGPNPKNLKGVVAFDRKTAYAIDVDGGFSKTTDGTRWSNPIATYSNIGGLVFMNRNVGWAPRLGGAIRTTNGGTTWTSHAAAGGSVQYNALHFADANTLWMVGDSGKIQYSADGGVNWTEQTSGTSQHLKGVWAVNATLAFAVGNSGTALKTTNAGATWSALPSGTTNAINSVFFLDASTGWIAGATGLIKKTTDGGATWVTQNAGTTADLFAIRGLSSDPNLLWATGANIALYTVSGGTAWVSPTPSVNGIGNFTYNAISFGDAYTGWIVGTNGIILKTTTGGRTP